MGRITCCYMILRVSQSKCRLTMTSARSKYAPCVLRSLMTVLTDVQQVLSSPDKSSKKGRLSGILGEKDETSRDKTNLNRSKETANSEACKMVQLS